MAPILSRPHCAKTERNWYFGVEIYCITRVIADSMTSVVWLMSTPAVVEHPVK